MSAQHWFNAINRKAPTAEKEKHHGNIRHSLVMLKHQARQDERHANKRETERLIREELSKE